MKIILQSNDNEEFEVDRDVIRLSTTLNTMFQDLGMDEPEPQENALNDPIPLANVNGTILRKVIQWCQYHKDDPPAQAENDNKERRTDDISSWDVEFLKVDQGTLFEIILAANYLDVRGLLDVACKTVANMIKGKSPEEIRRTFNIKNDFTPEEEDQIRKENACVSDERGQKIGILTTTTEVNPSDRGIKIDQRRSLTLTDFVACIENQTGQLVREVTTKFYRRNLELPVRAPQGNDDRYYGDGSELVEDIAYNLAEYRRQTVHGIILFSVKFVSNENSRDVYYHF